MWELLATVVPLAMGAAISPTTLAVELLILGGKAEPLRRGWAMAAGYGVGIVIWGVLALALIRGAGGSGTEPEWTGVVRLAAAAMLVIVGVRTLLHAPAHKPPKWAASQKPRLGGYLGVGVVLMLTNVTTLALFLPAMHAIGVSDHEIVGRAIAFVVVMAITMIPAIAPPLAVSIVGAPAERALGRLNAWLARHSRIVGAAVCFGFAILLAVQGISELS